MRIRPFTARIVLAAAVLGAAVVRPAGAIEQRPLPPFELTRPDGARVQSASLTDAPRYVLVYVTPGCAPCDRILQLVRKQQTPESIGRIVIVAGGSRADAAAYVAAHVPKEVASQVVWYSDEAGALYEALHLAGAPVIIGVRDGTMMWSLSGVINDASAVQGLVSKWVGY